MWVEEDEAPTGKAKEQMNSDLQRSASHIQLPLPISSSTALIIKSAILQDEPHREGSENTASTEINTKVEIAAAEQEENRESKGEVLH